MSRATRAAETGPGGGQLKREEKPAESPPWCTVVVMQAQRGDEQADAGLQSMEATVNDHGPGSLNRNDEDPSIVVVRQNVPS